MNSSPTHFLDTCISMLMNLLFLKLNFTEMMMFLKMMSMFIMELFYLLRTLLSVVSVDENLKQTLFSFSKLDILTATIFALILIKHFYYLSTSDKVYLIDFSCYQPPFWLRAPICSNLEHAEQGKCFNKESMDFFTKVLLRSGIGNSTYFPRAMNSIPLEPSLEDCLQEADSVFTVVEDLFHKTKITNPKTIDFLIVNCSMFNTTPSLTSMIINKFQLRSNISSYNLSGMGCSASLVSISLAKDLLKVHKNSLVLVVSCEIISKNGYFGRNKSMLLSNALFRVGGAAILLSNRSQDRKVAKYSLQHIIRTTTAYDDQSYRSIYQQPDEDGHVGVLLGREITKVAGKALILNITRLGPLVLPYSEQLKYGLTYIWRKLWPPGKRDTSIYVPNFKTAFKHFCIHAGGRAIIDVVQESLHLSEEDAEASRMTLYRYGNTSSSSVWYELCYIEAKGRMKKGDTVWQVALGSGFKCNSAVWKCISEINPKVRSAWSDRIHKYPVKVSAVFDC